ncbi:replication initiation protein [Streptococcus phage Javan174]|uniref:winged helix-turn-helix transcriptional regulator n=1 Tax=Streptococcus entericus TaxID=155680 RepID=UPI000369B52D|nr:winged helix-turn-helix transcriptional regulator [Streptococcus entericus]QBX24077.1 replication initiation protein [Streptococcus phage Javan174]
MLVVLSNNISWRIHPPEIAKRTGLSRSTVDKYFKRLEQLGYMRSIKKGRGYKQGAEIFWFAADFKLVDWYFEDYILPQFEKKFSTGVTEN